MEDVDLGEQGKGVGERRVQDATGHASEDTYKDRFLSHQDRGHEVGHP